MLGLYWEWISAIDFNSQEKKGAFLSPMLKNIKWKVNWKKMKPTKENKCLELLAILLIFWNS